ncbi:coenzyme F420-0:L-glutamate ligase [Conexibacter stalactiti]|uniref:Coenzyme F420-0:L-glutamate ligase n=1 Tax=Conexibacter stalactiti TaxID=1940611 RepID=A0ABU4HT67_9ACTN|nr:coenzyme F420-0:L-glutamate ligase [Conexibacter stalactiti]MDW5596515.1 coenzyme F420-0:L-glutamate ligase [Conexibacter stalactiti]MEC5037157.1 coenzyme F420-0:L-glutamate ligase [Conexibacter stalactiti]
MGSFSAVALDGLPEIAAGTDLAALLAQAAGASGAGLDGGLADGDVLVLAHKAVSKAEGAVRRLSDVTPSPRAQMLAQQGGKDPRHVQVVLDESAELLRAERGVLICVTHHGFVCANAGVDASNAPADEPETVILLPRDPDGSARALRARLRELTGAAIGVIVTDSFGRAWRHGQVDVAIGIAGVAPSDDWRGRTDSVGRELRATWIATADELAAAADLARGKDSRQPAVVLRGLAAHVTADDGPGVRALLRPAAEDMFRR